MIYGATKDRAEQVKDFQEDPDVKVFVGQLQTTGMGLTLTAASVAVFYSLDFSYANYEQSRARIHRIGQKVKCLYRTLVCITAIEDCIAGLPNGLDEIIRKYYLQKMSLREMSKRFFLGRDAIARRRDKAIAIISDCLAEL